MEKVSGVHIAVLMMLKNETKRLHVTLESIRNFADSLVIFDTGSTDDTIEILKAFSADSGIPLRLKEGDFTNFGDSRTTSMLFAYTFPDIDYILMMDCNDELRGGDTLRKYAVEKKDEEGQTGFLMCQQWWSGALNKYFNLRFLKARKGWEYKGRVHEWPKNVHLADGVNSDIPRISDEIAVLYQDRTQDDDKTGHRFARDRVFLLEDHKEDKSDPRTVFYLAQTCSCLGESEESLYYYKLRATMEGFQEEKFHSYLRAGEICDSLEMGWSESLTWYMRAMEHSRRAEPLLKMAEHYWQLADKQKILPPEDLDRYKESNSWFLAFTFANAACELEYPDWCILFVDKMLYDYKRWSTLGVVAFYAGRYREGKIAAQVAFETKVNPGLDGANVQAYIEAEKRQNEERKINPPNPDTKLTRQQFIDNTMSQIMAESPNANRKHTMAKVKRLWKTRNNL